MKSKHILVSKFFITLIVMMLVLYPILGKLGIILSISGVVIVINLLDKNLKKDILKEYLIIVGMFILISVSALIANLDYLNLIIITFAISVFLNHTFIYYKKNARTMGFFYFYMFLVYLKVPVAEFSHLALASVILGIIIMVAYFIITKGKKFEEVEEDEENYKKFMAFKHRFNVLSTISYTIAIFVMRYFYAYHGLWLAITLFVVLLPNKDLSRRKVVHRIIGTIIGTILFIIAGYIFVGKLSIILTILTIVALYFMLYSTKRYFYQAICITFFVLNLDAILYKTQSHIFLGEYRIFFTIVGCIIIVVLFEIEKGIEYLYKKFIKNKIYKILGLE